MEDELGLSVIPRTGDSIIFFSYESGAKDEDSHGLLDSGSTNQIELWWVAYQFHSQEPRIHLITASESASEISS